MEKSINTYNSPQILHQSKMNTSQTSAEITTEPATIQVKNTATQTETQTIDPTVLADITAAGLLPYVDTGIRRGVRSRYNRA